MNKKIVQQGGDSFVLSNITAEQWLRINFATDKVLKLEVSQPFRLCEPASVKVVSYDGKPTKEQKQQTRWSVCDKASQQGLLNYQGETLAIDCVPFDWWERTIEVSAWLFRPPEGVIEAKAQSVDVLDWIATIKKAEDAYPSLSGVEMTNAMRQIAGYDYKFFMAIYGGSPPTVPR